MAQRITGLYSAITIPAVYRSLMLALGATRSMSRYANEILKARPDMKMLDVGCGPAHILDHLPSLDYTGIDLNEKHIAFARERYGNRGRFTVGNAADHLKQEASAFDLINVSALLHHMSDNECTSLFRGLKPLLKPNGRIVTFDNVWLPKQRTIVKMINSLDSGLNIRTPESYIGLTDGLSLDVETKVFHDLLRIPYDHFVMTLTNRSE